MLQFHFHICMMKQFTNLFKLIKLDTIYIYILSAHEIGHYLYLYFVCSQNRTLFIFIFCLLTKSDTIYIYIVSGHLNGTFICVFGHNLPDIDMCWKNFFNEKGIYIHKSSFSEQQNYLEEFFTVCILQKITSFLT